MCWGYGRRAGRGRSAHTCGAGPAASPARPPGAARREGAERSRARRGAPRGTARMGREPRRQRPCRWGEPGGGRVTGAGRPGDTRCARCNREVLYYRGGRVNEAGGSVYLGLWRGRVSRGFVYKRGVGVSGEPVQPVARRGAVG